jgi:hypothetical protein
MVRQAANPGTDGAQEWVRRSVCLCSGAAAWGGRGQRPVGGQREARGAVAAAAAHGDGPDAGPVPVLPRGEDRQTPEQYLETPVEEVYFAADRDALDGDACAAARQSVCPCRCQAVCLCCCQAICLSVVLPGDPGGADGEAGPLRGRAGEQTDRQTAVRRPCRPQGVPRQRAFQSEKPTA